MTKEKEEVVQLVNELVTWLSLFKETKCIHLEMKMVENNSAVWWPETKMWVVCWSISRCSKWDGLASAEENNWLGFPFSYIHSNQPPHLLAKENRQAIQNIKEKQTKN